MILYVARANPTEKGTYHAGKFVRVRGVEHRNTSRKTVLYSKRLGGGGQEKLHKNFRHLLPEYKETAGRYDVCSMYPVRVDVRVRHAFGSN